MKTIKNLVLASALLMVSSLGFATSVTTPGTTAGSQGDIFLTLNGDIASFGGFFAGELDLGIDATQFFDLNIAGDADASSNAFTFHSNPLTIYDAIITIFQDGGDAVFGGDDSLVGMGTSSLVASLFAAENYYLAITGAQGTSYNGEISAVPVPAAGILFASALLGAGALGRRKKKATKSNMIGAFARAA